MLRTCSALVLLGGCAGLLCLGCGDRPVAPAPRPRTPVSSHVSGTVAEHAALAGGGGMPVTGVGVVIGLGTNGSRRVPAEVREHLNKQLARARMGSFRYGTADLTPRRLLQDLDTAVVTVSGQIPFGAPVGTRFDLYVVAAPQTGTRSLDGGYLMPSELRFALEGVTRPGGGTKVFGEARGPLFVNPYIDASDTIQAAKLREGRILGGGVVTVARPIALRLHDPDFAMARVIRDRINERFPAERAVANAENREKIKLHIPRAWRKDYRHFLRLVMHLPLLSSPDAWEQKARELVQAMGRPEANHDGLALVLEAMGRQVQSVLRELYASPNHRTAFFAARTGLRLDDNMAGEVVMRTARMSNSPLQVLAIEELGRHRDLLAAQDTLVGLLDNENATVRVAAYEALRERREEGRITRIDVGGAFELDLVRSKRRPVIYATQAAEPRMVVFGPDVSVAESVYYMTPGEQVTVTSVKAKDLAGPDKAPAVVLAQAPQRGKYLVVFRRLSRDGSRRLSPSFLIGFDVPSLVTALGWPPPPKSGPGAGEVKGMGLSYGQVVRVVQGLCAAGHIRAKFILQPPPALRRIYRGVTAVGRPDIPGP